MRLARQFFLMASLLVFPILVSPAQEGTGAYAIKLATKAPPKDLAVPILELLSDQVIQLEQGGKLVAEYWFCKSVPGEVPADKAKKDLGYRDLPETTLFGAVQFHTTGGDYRKQKIKPGVYTLRLGYQPQDGDHMGTAPHPEFLILLAAKLDTKAGTMPPKSMIERSMSSINTSHPAVLLLFPNTKAGEKTELASQPNNHWVLKMKRPVTAAGGKEPANVGIGLAVIGHASE